MTSQAFQAVMFVLCRHSDLKNTRRLLFLVVFACLARPARSQGIKPTGSWEIEAHIGGVWTNNTDTGSGRLPEPRPGFTTATGTMSRHVPSWFFGDGSLLLNQVQALPPALSERIVPLDAILTQGILQRSTGGAFGVRITRLLNDRFAVEGNAEYAHDRLGIDPSALAAIEATRGSFYPTWTSFFSAWKSSSPVRSFGVSSSSEIANEKAGQTLVTGNLSIALKKNARTIPFLIAGGGVLINAQARPGADLIGAYSSFSQGVISERDHVQLRFDTDRYAPVGIAGGGIKYYLTSRWGLRFDARVQFAPNRTENIVSALPGVGRCFLCFANPGPTIVFGDSPSIQMGGITTTPSLSPALVDFQTYRSTGGTQRIFTLTAGVLRRF